VADPGRRYTRTQDLPDFNVVVLVGSGSNPPCGDEASTQTRKIPSPKATLGTPSPCLPWCRNPSGATGGRTRLQARCRRPACSGPFSKLSLSGWSHPAHSPLTNHITQRPGRWCLLCWVPINPPEKRPETFSTLSLSSTPFIVPTCDLLDSGTIRRQQATSTQSYVEEPPNQSDEIHWNLHSSTFEIHQPHADDHRVG
jgi:hypothetical protein